MFLFKDLTNNKIKIIPFNIIMSMNRETMETKFKLLNIKSITQANYINNIFLLYYKLNPLQKDKNKVFIKTFKDAEGVIKFIDDTWSSCSTKNTYINAILNLLKVANLYKYKNKFIIAENGKATPKLKPISQKYKDYTDVLQSQIQEERESEEFKTLKNIISQDVIDGLIKNNLKKYNTNLKLDYLQNVILLHVYFMNAPPRADISEMLIVETKPEVFDDRFNYAILDEKIFYYFNYKTDNRGFTDVNFTNEIYDLLLKLYNIRKTDNNDKVYVLLGARNNKPLTPQTLSKKFKRLSGVSINDARKQWINKPENKKASILANENAKNMMNSTKTQGIHYLKN